MNVPACMRETLETALSHKDGVYSLANMLSNIESLTEMTMSAMLLCLHGESSSYTGNCFLGCDSKVPLTL